MNDGAARRVEALVAGARRLAEPTSELGRRARRALAASTGLSPEGVELALTECLETRPSAAEIAALVASVGAARRVHVVLPANVFVAAHRAIALALASSADVRVRASRREPQFAELLAEAAPGLFTLTDAVAPEPGDELWVYGGDDALAAIFAQTPPGVTLHAQGPGFGVALVARTHATPAAARALAADIVPFDQRGCLSPRAALVVGSPDDAEHFARLVADALTEAAEHVPLGRLDDAELADARAFRDAHAYAGDVFPAGPGAVAVLDAERLVLDAERLALAPVGRNLVVTATSDPFALLVGRAAEITALGMAAPDELAHEVGRRFPCARGSALGRMQRPAFDGPADRR